jgi:hypothetical protein
VIMIQCLATMLPKKLKLRKKELLPNNQNETKMEQQTFSFYSNATNINFRQKMQCIFLMKIFAFFFMDKLWSYNFVIKAMWDRVWTKNFRTATPQRL